MKYMGNADWWNKRFKDRTRVVMNPEKKLENDISFFPAKGKILDVACGDGRNSIYMAGLGFQVHAIDFSEEALSRLNYFSLQENLNIKTTLADLTKADTFLHLEQYDGIVINHYRFAPHLYHDLEKYLKSDGILWVNGFRDIPKDNPNITEADLLSDADFAGLEHCKLRNKLTYETGERKFVRYLWKK